MRKIIALISLLICTISFGQITIDNTTYSPTQLVDGVLIPVGSGTTISNITFSGVYNNSNRYQIGYFATAGTTLGDMGFTDGVVLSTGNTNHIPLTLGVDPGSVAQMATNYTSCTTGEIRETGTCGTFVNDVNILAGSNNYYNAAILEFDFVPVSNSVQFRYVFGSEEYEDDGGFINYQCSNYNDKFGFLISGPGITGANGYDNNAVNIATLANGSEVGINSVNNGIVGSSGGGPSASNCLGVNPAWIQNVSTAEFLGPIDGTELNGNTIALIATRTGLTPGQTYHIRLIVTDVNDGTYDAVVYLEAGSFTTDPPCTNPVAPTASTTIQPNCITPTGTIEVTAPLGGNLEYSIDGVNYQSVTTFAGLIPGSYDVTAQVVGTTCVSTITSVTVNPLPTGPAAPTGSATIQPDCTTPSGTIVITAPLGGTIQYSIDGTNYQSGTTFSGLTPGSYNVTSLDTTIGCESTISVIVVNNIPSGPAAPTGSVTVQPDCIIPTGTIVLTAPLGTTLEYSVDGITYQSGTTFTGLVAGTYDVTVQDTGTGCASTITQITINPPAGAPADPLATVTVQPTCLLPTGTIEITTPTGATLEYSIDGTTYQSGLQFYGLNPGSYNVTAMDNATGCVSGFIALVVDPIPSAPTAPTVLVTDQPDCTVSTGTITVSLPTGTNLEYSINGINYQTNLIFTGITTGSYDVTVIDIVTGCISQETPITINSVPQAPVLVGAFNYQVDCDNLTAEYEVTAPIGNEYQYFVNATQTLSGTYVFSLLPSETIDLYAIDTTTGCVTQTLQIVADDLPNPDDCNLDDDPGPVDCGELFVPTAFSPNEDNNNDEFSVKINPNCVESMTLRVFDRWGELIFETTNPEIAWDGTYKGKKLNAAVFVYTLEIKLSNETEKQKLSGNVTLIK